MKPEDKARKTIDDKLHESGWVVQDYDNRDISLPGVAIREFPTKNGRVDYALFTHDKLVGIIEAKKTDAFLTAVEAQTKLYRDDLQHDGYNPVFLYKSTGIRTSFCDTRDPDHRSREVFTFHRPKSLHTMYEQPSTLRHNLRYAMPELHVGRLRRCQIDAICGLERSLGENRPRSLIHMTMGSGKTYMAVSESYRLLRFAKARRILFLVDRRELGRQAEDAYSNYNVQDAGTGEENRKFSSLYNIQHLTTHGIHDASAVVISTIQRLYSIISKTEHTDEEDELSLFETDETDDIPKSVQYNDDIPIDAFDIIIVDEAHRSIYNKWRQVLEYFDAFIIGLTATPHEHTRAFFQNTVSSYTMDTSVMDGINVDSDCYQIHTEIGTNGIFIEAGDDITKVDRDTGEKKAARADKSQWYKPSELDYKIEAEDHIRTVIKAFKHLQKEHFKRPEYVPKTLIFAKKIQHADTITRIVREEYGKGDDFCQIIVSTTKNVRDRIREFKMEVDFRIAVSVDMLNTGFDMQAIECLLFLRNSESAVYVEQMVGRGCRTIDPDRLQEITPDAVCKDSYLIVDAAGALEALDADKPTKPPIGRGDNKTFEKIISKAADGRATNKELVSLTSRLNKMKKRIDSKSRESVERAAGMTIDNLIQMIRENVNTDNHLRQVVQQFGEEYTDRQLSIVQNKMILDANKPFFNPDLRKAILDAVKQDDLVITQKQDELVGMSIINIEQNKNKFTEFLEKNRDKFMALQILYNTPYRLQNITFYQISELAEAIKQPPFYLTPDKIWDIYERLEGHKVRKNARVQLTDIISLVWYVSGRQDSLVPYGEFVMAKFEKWLETQRVSGAQFTANQEAWLRNIANLISVSCKIGREEIKNEFHDRGGLTKFYELFPDGDQMLVQMHRELTNFEE